MAGDEGRGMFNFRGTGSGVLVLENTDLDKPYARKMDLVHHTWLGNHHAVVKGVDVLTLVWTDSEQQLRAINESLTSRTMGMTENNHFGALIDMAKARGFHPEYVLLTDSTAD